MQVVQNFRHGFMLSPPKVLLVSPTHVYESDPSKEGFEGAEEKSKQLGRYFEKRANELSCHFVDAAKHIAPCIREGIHWQVDTHKKFADLVTGIVKLIDV